MVSASEEHEDYVFAVLTGYVDAPAGIELREGQNYNPYFPGCAIAMPKILFNEVSYFSLVFHDKMSTLNNEQSIVVGCGVQRRDTSDGVADG